MARRWASLCRCPECLVAGGRVGVPRRAIGGRRLGRTFFFFDSVCICEMLVLYVVGGRGLGRYVPGMECVIDGSILEIDDYDDCGDGDKSIFWLWLRLSLSIYINHDPRVHHDDVRRQEMDA
jgi:hypothetical protein